MRYSLAFLSLVASSVAMPAFGGFGGSFGGFRGGESESTTTTTAVASTETSTTTSNEAAVSSVASSSTSTTSTTAESSDSTESSSTTRTTAPSGALTVGSGYTYSTVCKPYIVTFEISNLTLPRSKKLSTLSTPAQAPLKPSSSAQAPTPNKS